MGARSLLRPEKKDTVICLAGARSLLRLEKKKIQSSVFWVRGSGDYDWKKKDTVVCLTGCAVVLFFVVAENFDYDRKKKIQSSVWRVSDDYYDRKKKIQSSFSCRDRYICISSI